MFSSSAYSTLDKEYSNPFLSESESQTESLSRQASLDDSNNSGEEAEHNTQPVATRQQSEESIESTHSLGEISLKLFVKDSFGNVGRAMKGMVQFPVSSKKKLSDGAIWEAEVKGPRSGVGSKKYDVKRRWVR